MQELKMMAACLGEDYPTLLKQVKSLGDSVRPRGELVKEVSPFDLTLPYPRHCLTRRPGINRALIDAERLLIMAGSYDKDIYEAVSPGVTKLLTGHGAYGPRIAGQMLVVEKELSQDPDSRRAIVYIGRSGDLEDTQKGAAPQDVPCTATWQFLVRDGSLHMFVNMRSWDLVWGLSGDVPVFVTVQLALASALGLYLGRYHHRAVSGHIYERHFDLDASIPEYGNCVLDWIPSGGSFFVQQTTARSVAHHLGMMVLDIMAAESVEPFRDDIVALQERFPHWSNEIGTITKRAGVTAQKASDS